MIEPKMLDIKCPQCGRYLQEFKVKTLDHKLITAMFCPVCKKSWEKYEGNKNEKN